MNRTFGHKTDCEKCSKEAGLNCECYEEDFPTDKFGCHIVPTNHMGYSREGRMENKSVKDFTSIFNYLEYCETIANIWCVESERFDEIAEYVKGMLIAQDEYEQAVYHGNCSKEYKEYFTKRNGEDSR